ncbi:MAG: DNA lyase [Candidatus Kapabacteria bacterium]|jgi:N-glycosylase/DNA lyase|nr:DNA lyase [Candidatus Kapabacteria bacterium]
MKKYALPDELILKYKELKPAIDKRLKEFAAVSADDYFYELCFCLCTPQSKARNAFEIQKKLMARDFRNKPFDPTELLRNPDHYIRFHNQKAKRLLALREMFFVVEDILISNLTAPEKRLSINKLVNGIGMKESSHFMRNIGYRNLSILDRHILKHLTKYCVYKEVPKVGSVKQYLEAEKGFFGFSKTVGIPVDELDLLFWSAEAGEILK